MTHILKFAKNHRMAIGASVAAGLLLVGVGAPAIASADAPVGPVVTAAGWVTGDNGSSLTLIPTAGPRPLMPTAVDVAPSTTITFNHQPGAQMSSIIPGDAVTVVGNLLPNGAIRASSVNVGFQP